MNHLAKQSLATTSPPQRRNFFTLLIVALIVAVSLSSLSLMAQEATEAAEVSTADIVTAANAFLGSLDDAQSEAVMFDFNDETQRNNWSNFPTGIFNRAGLAYATLTEEQRALELTLLQTALSAEGYEKLMGAMIGDEVLAQTESNYQQFGYGLYFISFLGTPSETDPWILQYGGHHFALNITFSGSQEILTPSHTGCQPCTYIINDEQVSVLGDEYTKALALLNALDANQQATAILDYSVTNLVLGPGEEERALEPEGLPGSEMTADQQAMLLDVISEWVNIAPEPAASVRMAELAANINDTYFAWSGDTSADSASSYFRVTGPTLLIEFAPQGVGGGGGGNGGGPGGGGGGTPPTGGGNGGGPGAGSDTEATENTFALDLGTFEVIEDANALYHVHTIYRDPTNAYGSAVTGS